MLLLILQGSGAESREHRARSTTGKLQMLVEAMKKGAVGGKLVGQEDRLATVEEESEAQVSVYLLYSCNSTYTDT